MDSAAREQIEAWLRYFDDLGLAPFYQDRGTLELSSASPSTAHSAPPSQVGGSSTVGARLAVPSQLAPPTQPAARLAPFPAAPAVPIAAAPSLFDAVERIEGDTLQRIRSDIGDCTRCKLCRARTNIVFGDGSPQAQLVFVGEGPGHDEDLQGLPFVGRAGKLLTQMIEAMGLRREDVYICNVVKCRAPENRVPEKDEIATCSPFLVRQLAVIQPKVIVCLGNCAAQTLIGTNKPLSQYRGEWFDYRGARLMATYHPAYLLRSPNEKVKVWNDLKKVMAVLGLKPPRPRPRS